MQAATDRSWREPQRLAGVALLVCLLCWASIALTRDEGRIAAIWLSNGLVLGLLLSAPLSAWPGIASAAFAGNLAANLAVQDSLSLALALAACNSLEILIAGGPLVRRFGSRCDLSHGPTLLYFVLFALILAPALSGLLASFVLSQLNGSDWLAIFAVWFPADALGLMTVTPLVLALRQQFADPLRIHWRRLLPPWLFLIASCGLLFSQSTYPLLFLAFPPLLLLTYLQGAVGSALGITTLTAMALVATLNHSGPLALVKAESMHMRILMLQLFVAVATAQTLVLGVIQAQRQRLTRALRDSERQLRTITDNLPALVAQFDTEERYRFVNAHIGRVFGDDRAAMIGRTLREVRGEAVYAEIGPYAKRALAGETVRFESHGIASGKPHHYQANYVPDVAADGSVQGFFAMTFDITERKNAELRQAADEERLRTITDNVPALISYFDRQGIYRFCNQTHSDWFGKPASEYLGQHYRDALDAQTAEAQAPHIHLALSGQRVDTELLLTIQGNPCTLSASYIPHLDGSGQLLGVYKLMSDITRLKNVQHQLYQLARHDALTGLANRREFQERLQQIVALSARTGSSHALLYLDIDHFKSINDTHGHAAGDAVLCEIASRLVASVRHTDTVARLAGDEFVVILDNPHSAEESQGVARKIVIAMEQPVLFERRMLKVSVSIGVAFDSQSRHSEEELLAVADGALYEAKAAGRNTFKFSQQRPNRPLAVAELPVGSVAA